MGNLESAARHVLGQRLKAVSSEEFTNFDGERVLRVRVVYDAEKGISVEEMDKVLDLLMDLSSPTESAFPVIDFQADSDPVAVAAE